MSKRAEADTMTTKVQHTWFLYFDAENRLAVASNGAFTVAYALTADGWDAGYAVTLTNGLAVTRAVTRDPHRRHLVTAVSNAVGVSSHTVMEYGYDILGNVTDRNADTFSYNARYELAYALLGADRFNYSYDSIGNNLWISVNAVTNTYAANRLNQYSLISNHVNHVNPVRIHPTYDADGNMRWDGRMWHTWDAENRLVRSEPGFGFATNGACRLEYVYNHKNLRVAKIKKRLTGRGAGYPLDPSQPGTWDVVETRTFVYDGWNLCREVETSGGVAVTNIYVWGLDLSGTLQGAGGVGGLLAVLRNGTPYFPCYDANGNVTDYVDAGGTVVAHREYGPYGKTVAAAGPLVHDLHFWFSTKYLDEETGLYYYGYRFYSPEIMRWLSRDPMGEVGHELLKSESKLTSDFRDVDAEMLNLYRFCANNPLAFTDAYGESAVDWSLCTVACFLGFQSSDELRHLYWAWTDASKLPRHMRRQLELEARKILTGSRAKPTQEAIEKAVKELAEKRLKTLLAKKAGSKIAKKLAPNVVPGLGQIVSLILTSVDVGEFCWCGYKCSTGRFY